MRNIYDSLSFLHCGYLWQHSAASSNCIDIALKDAGCADCKVFRECLS